MTPLGREAALDRAASLAARPGRVLLGLAGAPGAGKSTFAALVAGRVPGAVVVPMDGFHLTTAQLRERDAVERRGAPDTFDADGFVALLRRLRAGGPVRAPAFDRAVEEPVADAIAVPADCPLVVVEGNYLLLDTPPWREVAALLDECWFVAVPEPVRLTRLIARHVEFGRSPAEARARATTGPDGANARLVAVSRSRADAVVGERSGTLGA